MWSRKYVVPEICRPETGENMSAPKKNFGGAAPEPPHGGLHPPRGGLAAPPLTLLHARHRRSDTTTRAKNITHTQQIQAQLKLLSTIERMKRSQEQCTVQQQVYARQRKVMEVTQRLQLVQDVACQLFEDIEG